MPTKDFEEINPEEFPFDEEEEATEFGDAEYSTNRVILFHCKPVYNFQSIEFDMEINPDDPNQIERMFSIYASIVKRLQEVAVDQPKQVYIPPKEPLATDRQKETMDRYGIKYDAKTCTTKQAQKLINESMKG